MHQISLDEFLSSIGILASSYHVSSFVSQVVQDFVVELGLEAKGARFTELSQFVTKMVEEIRLIGQDSTIIVK